MSDDPTAPAERIRYRPFAARRARKAAAKARVVGQRAWWHQRWSEAMTRARALEADTVSRRDRRYEADVAELGSAARIRLPDSRVWINPAAPADDPDQGGFVHEHTAPVLSPTGRWGKGEPYRNPDRAAKLARSGRLRKDLPS